MVVFDKPYDKYWKGTITVDVMLPEQLPVCANCPFIKSRHNTTRCLITDEPILKPSDYRGDFCPIKWKVGGDE